MVLNEFFENLGSPGEFHAAHVRLQQVRKHKVFSSPVLFEGLEVHLGFGPFSGFFEGGVEDFFLDGRVGLEVDLNLMEQFSTLFGGSLRGVSEFGEQAFDQLMVGFEQLDGIHGSVLAVAGKVHHPAAPVKWLRQYRPKALSLPARMAGVGPPSTPSVPCGHPKHGSWGNVRLGSGTPSKLPTFMRHLVVVLGDQLNADSLVFDDFDPSQDCVWMAERIGESQYVWSSKVRSAVFLSAMRHFAASLPDRFPLLYTSLTDPGPDDLVDLLALTLQEHQPRRLILVRPGEHRLRVGIQACAQAQGVEYVERPDVHFFCARADFKSWAKGKTSLRMEHFYRWMRQRENILMEGAKPIGGKWNFDAQNRGHFGHEGPGWLPAPRRFAPDALTQQVLSDVENALAEHPGDLSGFDWPTTRDEALIALDDFLDHRLPAFGHYQDAMWQGEPLLYHARLSASLNLRLLSPREVVDGALQRYQKGRVDLSSVEGFIRQILGWREFVRGVYWLNPDRLLASNALEAHAALPGFYWTGDTDMQCLREVISQTLSTGYAHHIQRLMVTGNFALLLGVEPHQVHEWYLAVYTDAVEWVEAPNTLGMSQFADGGRMVSKPYAASGRYIERMSNYCEGCRFNPSEATGDFACPFTTLYWDFLDRHRERFWHHPRAAMQWRSLSRIPSDKLDAIRTQAANIRKQWG